ncbi:hypothetical protein AW169_11015 [Corynebacterium stationis]|nr:hypothetical protein AW169_11015 [Corynebacterium stationis]
MVTVGVERPAHLQNAFVRGWVKQQVLHKAQRSYNPLVGDYATWLQKRHRRGLDFDGLETICLRRCSPLLQYLRARIYFNRAS